MNVRLDKRCHCESLRQEETFSDWADFDKFSSAISDDPRFLLGPVEEDCANAGLPEKWYRCARCGTIFRLVEPDPPFRGLWTRVKPVPRGRLK